MISKGDEPDTVDVKEVQIKYPYTFYPLLVNMTVEIAALLESNEAKSYLKDIERSSLKLQRFINENVENKGAWLQDQTPHAPNSYRHKQLHAALDELSACYFVQTNKTFSDSTIMELMAWSHEMTQKATCEKKDD